jgi:TrmH family RNA methyltransferase
MHSPISSPHNVHVRRAARLRDRRGRDQQQRILIEGAREIQQAAQAGVAVERVFVPEQPPPDDHAEKIVSALLQQGAVVHRTGAPAMRKVCYGQRAELVAIARTPQPCFADFNPPPCPLLAILENIQKPGNVGAILRTADAAGVDGVVIVDAGTDLFNPHVIRASLGTVFSLPVFATSFHDLQDWLHLHPADLILTRVDARWSYTEIDFRKPTAIVLGGEAPGLSTRWNALPHRAVALPMRGQADSLNVSVTAAVMFYESRRQRDLAEPADHTAPAHANGEAHAGPGG